LSQGIASPGSCQREVFDENYVVWSFDRCEETDQAAYWESILGSKEWSEDELKPSVIDLPSLKEEVPFIDHSQEACEVLGPVKMVHGHPIKVQSALAGVQNVTMLYRYFDVVSNNGDSTVELHSLQLLPFYTAGRFLLSHAVLCFHFFSLSAPFSSFIVSNDTEKPLPQLSGMICFVSNSKQGFIYNVFKKAEFLAHCTYTTETSMASICDNLLYSVTNQALETYVVPIYAAVANQLRAMRASDGEDKLPLDNTVVQSDVTDVNGDVLSAADGTLATSQDEESQENKFTHFGFPVYDLEILQKVEKLHSLKERIVVYIKGFVGNFGE
jgi:hypothetical protein